MNRRTLLSVAGGGIALTVAGSTNSFVTNTPRYSDYVDIPERNISNPYGKQKLTVQLSQQSESQYDAFVLTRQALDYWEEYSEKFAGYPIIYNLSRNHDTPDVLIRFVDSIEECGSDSTDNKNITGCADLVKDVDLIITPVTAHVITGRGRDETLRTLIHEIGHTLGLTHHDEPANFMSNDASSV